MPRTGTVRSWPVMRVAPPVGWVRRLAKDGAAAPRGTSPSLGGAGRLLERNARVYRHVWLLLVSGIAEPLFYLLSLGVGLGPLVGHVTGPDGAAVPYREFVAPGLLAVSAMNGAIYDSTFNVYLKLKYFKIYEAMLAAPMRPIGIALGEIGWALLRGGLYATAFMAVMAAMGLVQSLWALLGVPVALLIGFAFAGLGMACTTFMRSWQDFDYVLLASLPLFLFSTTFYPLSVYPRPLAVIVEWTPLYQGVVLLRDLVLGTVGPDLLWRAAYLAAMGLAGLAISGRRIARLLLS
jgi:lipooligosaccharide transport system permease protein